MTNRRIQDISIRDTSSSSGAGRSKPAGRKTAIEAKKTAPAKRTRPEKPKKTIQKRKPRSRTPSTTNAKQSTQQNGRGAAVLWGLAGILLVVLVYVVSAAMATADILVTLKQQRFPIDTELTVFQNTGEGQLDYDTVTFERSVEIPVQADEVVTVTEKARGTIAIYNAHQTTPQRLIEETRFRAANGLIYKTGSGTTTIVPGYTLDTGGEIVPGMTEVQVFAAEPGPEHNQEPTDFVIPGFEGGPKFDGFYARSIGPLSGGALGTRPALSDEEIDDIRTRLLSEVRRQAENEARYRIPEGYIVLPDVMQIEQENLRFDTTETGAFEAKMEAVVTVYLINEQELTNALLASQSNFSGDTEEQLFSIVNLSEVDFDLEQVTENEARLRASGDVLVRWLMHETDIQRKVVGITRSGFADTLQSERAIQSAEAELRPAWVRRFPKKTDNINIFYENIDR